MVCDGCSDVEILGTDGVFSPTTINGNGVSVTYL